MWISRTGRYKIGVILAYESIIIIIINTYHADTQKDMRGKKEIITEPRIAQVSVDELRSASNAALVWIAEIMTDERARKRLTLPNASAAHSVYHASESRRSLHNPKIPLLKTPIWISEAKRAKTDFWID